jgi:branched-chain amino acid transport system permease protein
MEQAIVSGLTQGAAYALVAVGLALVYSVSRTINLAHGAFVVLGIMLVQALAGPLGLVGAIVVALLLGAAAAAGMEVLAVRRVADAPPLSGLLLTLGLAFAFQGLLRVVFGPDEFSSEPFTASRSVDVLGATIPAQAFWLIGVAVVVSIGLELIVARTFIGRTLVACAQDPAGARLCGIPVARVRAGTYALAGALGVLAGVLLGPLTFVTYESAISFALLGLIAAALGGLGSLRGAVLGGVFLGLAESLAVTYVSSQMKTPITFAVLLVLLTLRPRGFVRGVTA